MPVGLGPLPANQSAEAQQHPHDPNNPEGHELGSTVLFVRLPALRCEKKPATRTPFRSPWAMRALLHVRRVIESRVMPPPKFLLNGGRLARWIARTSLRFPVQRADGSGSPFGRFPTSMRLHRLARGGSIR